MLRREPKALARSENGEATSCATSPVHPLGHRWVHRFQLDVGTLWSLGVQQQINYRYKQVLNPSSLSCPGFRWSLRDLNKLTNLQL